MLLDSRNTHLPFVEPTILSVLPVPDLSQKPFHVDLLALHLDHPWMFQHPPGRSSSGWFFLETEYQVSHCCLTSTGSEALHVPAFDEVFETLTPVNTLGWLILEFRYRLSDDVSEQIYQSSPWLHFRPVRWEWEPMLSDFQQRDSQRPDV